MRDIDPLTENQKLLYDAYADDKNIVAYGCAGTGKDLYHALQCPSGCSRRDYTIRKDLHRQVACGLQRDRFLTWRP